MKKALFLLMLSVVSPTLFSQPLNWSPFFSFSNSGSAEIVMDESSHLLKYRTGGANFVAITKMGARNYKKQDASTNRSVVYYYRLR